MAGTCPRTSDCTLTFERILVCAVVADVEAEDAVGVGQPQQLQQVCERGALVPVNLAAGRHRVGRVREQEGAGGPVVAANDIVGRSMWECRA